VNSSSVWTTSLGAWSDELLVLLLVLPVLAMLLGFVLGGRWAERVTLLMLPVGLALAGAVAALVFVGGAPIGVDIGGFYQKLRLENISHLPVKAGF